MKGELERFVRPISFSDGKFELALEQGAPPNLANELSRKLEAWTARRWMIVVARDGGGETLSRQKQSAAASAEKAALELPAIKAIFAVFPDAKIVRVGAPEALPTPTEPDTPQEDADDEYR